MQSSELRKNVGQLFAVGFHGLTPSPEIKTLIHDHGVGGIVLFKRNIQDAAQLQALTLALQEEAKAAGHEHPLFIGIDQENGWVTRISPPIAPQLPGAMALGATYDPELAYKVGAATGETLRLFGINMNYAPVCDINSEPLNPVIGVRSFGDDPGYVGRFAGATAQGLREQKVVPTVKHFPGHGDTAVDSHYGLPVIKKTRDQLEQCELRPFRRAVAEGIEAVMTAHISLPALGETELPATLSADALNILREDMQYDGMVVTDCLEMDGIRATYGTEQGAVLALGAGSDSIMICHTYNVQVASINRVIGAIESGEVSTVRLMDALRRVAKVKQAFLNWDTALQLQSLDGLIPINDKSVDLAANVYSKSATIVREKPGVLSKLFSESSTVLFLFPGEKTPAGGAVDGEGLGRKGSHNATEYLEILKKQCPNATEVCYTEPGLSSEQWSLVEAVDVIVFTSINARESPYQRRVGLELAQRAQNIVSIAACSPYDFLDDASIETYVTTYEPTVEAFFAAVKRMKGQEIVQKGQLPIGPLKPTPGWIAVDDYVSSMDLLPVLALWKKALPTYPLLHESPERLLSRKNAHHFVVRGDTDLVGFCLLYTEEKRDVTCGYLAVLAVDPKKQGLGVGTALIEACRSWLKKEFKNPRLELGSSFPRFWPGIPTDLPSETQQFFVHRGFQLNPPSARSVDLYQDIRNFEVPVRYAARARERGYTFGPLKPEDFLKGLSGQKRNFSDNEAWVQKFMDLDPTLYPSSIMTAWDYEGNQVAWALMLGSECDILRQDWVFPPMCGPRTGLIGCVGVDKAHRKNGIGLALVGHAIENMKNRGIEGVFVDWVALDGWYEQLGFEVWRSYRPGRMAL
ncbi:putative beta-N-acetylglucosaminidase [Aspergillus steynii IBT 23096]|uniref:Putative beta-N-acetylglucosaminidase n=1 Tax=Aspergillus steynii IBT 23096 TaxID=1392250 RepID=A0A2I2GIY7_9EURO|nr:putative beta-N-acetylglucosaminidase [Aspergillus steynii IBT 23096]PLB52828.1 putative beta-N-acetylglucosaminidase [Aspergillus steynii IBT 23096]